MFEKPVAWIRSTLRGPNAALQIGANTWFVRLTVISIGLSALLAGLLFADPRMLDGEVIWLKPLKFAISFVVYFATLAAVTARLSGPWRQGWVMLSCAGITAAAFLFEMAYISGQAARQEKSHFNESSVFHELMYGLMGIGAAALMIIVAIVGWIAWKDTSARLRPQLRLGIATGFIGSAVLTFWTAGELAGNGGRFIGVVPETGAFVPILGWSMEVGDLRPAHFFALHAMQVLPGLGIFADHYNLPDRFIWIASALYVVFTGLIFFQALQGNPLISV